ncbi:HPr kinase/phosphorylase [Amaricoccus macauensis]|uniref:HPr kinase/phosphorylase n=1 Tax=Amaricoccus macauensis TaxID=57001 RepID=UPI003C79D22B
MILHASAVSMEGRGLLVLGKSGAGKSGLALRLMALGARLVSDDRVILEARADGVLMATAPGQIAGLIEARGVGLLQVDPVSSARIVLAVDLDTRPEARLPQDRCITIMGCELELISGRDVPNMDAILAILLQEGRKVAT